LAYSYHDHPLADARGTVYDDDVADIADKIAERLAIYLGPHTARVAVKTFTQKALGRGPETLTIADIPKLNAALRPMLRTFVGRVQCEVVLEQISLAVGV
jgi:hypothetical protein